MRNLVGIGPIDFRSRLEEFLNLRDGAMEGYVDPTKQRDLSVRFHWGHQHEFGEFTLPGRMGWRHVQIPAAFHTDFGLPLDLSGTSILDIGVWTGGTSLLLCAMGANVVAIEEVRKYTEALTFLKDSFNIENLTVKNESIYDLINASDLFDTFDYVLFSGVIYHLTDPIIAARTVFNLLKNGGTCFIESGAIASERSLVAYEGPNVFLSGTAENLDRSGWNWFVPSKKALEQMFLDVGFDEVKNGTLNSGRVLSSAKRMHHKDMNRAGLSVRNIR